MSRMNGYDKWLMSGYDDQPDYDEREEKAYWDAKESMRPGEQFDPFETRNWCEACVQLEFPEEIDDPSKATEEQKKQVKEYWYKIAYDYFLD